MELQNKIKQNTKKIVRINKRIAYYTTIKRELLNENKRLNAIIGNLQK